MTALRVFLQPAKGWGLGDFGFLGRAVGIKSVGIGDRRLGVNRGVHQNPESKIQNLKSKIAPRH